MPRLLTSSTKLCGLVAAAAALSAALMLAIVSPSPASASTRQISIFQDDSFLFNPAAGLAEVRALGATTVRLTVQWYSLAPSPGSTKAPKFNASDPNAYSAAKWAPYDAFVKTAAQMGIKVLFQAGGGAPRWARGQEPAGVVSEGHQLRVDAQRDDVRSVRPRPDPAL